MEINFNHGDPLELADQAFLFKRTVRQAALKHDVYATFMAKPLANEPGSSMHIHQSVVDKRTGKNLFADSKAARHRAVPQPCRRPAALPAGGHAAAGAQRQFLSPPAAAIRRADQRALGHRQPHRAACACRSPSAAARRIENRLAGADANPYLAIAASLACGYLGMIERLKPTNQIEGSAYRLRAHPAAARSTRRCSSFKACKPISALLGETFMHARSRR